MTLRRAEAADAPALGRVLSDWIDETPWMPRLHTRAEDEGFVAGLIADCDVWTKEGTTGFIAVRGTKISAIYVAPTARGAGLGQRLIGSAKADRKALNLWTFQANGGAIRFYLREGFREVERTDGAANEEALPDVRMRWEAQR